MAEINSTAISDPVPLPAGNIELAVREIRAAALDDLINPRYLEHVLLPKLGFNNESLHEFPSDLYPWCGFGIKSWQYPAQFSKYLVALSRCKLKSYMEIGVRHGGTFIITVEYLSRFNEISAAVAIDIETSPILEFYVQHRPELRYIVQSSQSEAVKTIFQERMWDLVLIDGDHSFEGCWLDFQSVRNQARFVAFHDIVSAACPGVVKAWNLVSSASPDARLQQFTSQYPDVMARTGNTYLGIGLVQLA